MALKRRRRSKKRRDYTLYAAISSLIVIFAVVFVILARGSGDGSDSVTQTDKPGAAASISATDTAPATTGAPDVITEAVGDTSESTSTAQATETEAPATEPAATESAATEAPATDAVVTDAPEPIETVGGGVPYSGPAELSVISNSVFIGDSRTEGLKIYTSLLSSGARVYANKGLAVNTIFNEAFVQTDAGTVTAIDAMRYDPGFDSAYVALGINELAWGSIDSYIQKFGDLVTTILEINPAATVYIEAILPVTQSRSSSDEIFNNPRIAEFNVRLRSLAESLGVRFLDVTEMFAANGGALPEGASGDGIHLNKEYCEKWLDYIIEHRA